MDDSYRLESKVKRSGSPSTPVLGLVLPDRQPPEEDLRFAVLAEAAGLSAIWCYEVTRDSQIRAACLAQHTKSLQVGTCVSLWHSTPVAMAVRVAEIQRWTGGRFQFGLGVGIESANRDYHNTPYERPVARLNEYIRVIRGAFQASSDQPLRFDGKNFSVCDYPGADLEGLQPPPMLLAGIGPAMIRLAVSAADGIILSPSATPWHTNKAVLTQNRAALETRAASNVPFTVVALARCSIDADAQAARERARESIAQYTPIPAHTRIAEAHGFGLEVAKILAAWRRGDAKAAAAAVSDDMVEAFALAGTPDDVRRKIHRWDGIVDSLALLSPESCSSDEIAANVSAIIDTFACEVDSAEARKN